MKYEETFVVKSEFQNFKYLLAKKCAKVAGLDKSHLSWTEGMALV